MDKGTIFSREMVLAQQRGLKTMTRRMAWGKSVLYPDLASEHQEDFEVRGYDVEPSEGGCFVCKPSPWTKVSPGDRIWVRENFLHYGIWRQVEDAGWHFFPSKAPDGFGNVEYVDRVGILHLKAPSRARKGFHLRPSIYMPRWASRVTLDVTATKREPLQDISHEDAVAEGVGIFPKSMSAQKRFKELWESLHGDGSWALNPEVVALTFAVHQRNIDAKAAA